MAGRRERREKDRNDNPSGGVIEGRPQQMKLGLFDGRSSRAGPFILREARAG